MKHRILCQDSKLLCHLLSAALHAFLCQVMEELPHRLCFESSVEESQMALSPVHRDNPGSDSHDWEPVR